MKYLKNIEDQNTRILSTKVNPRQYEQLDDWCKRRGFSSMYEFMQFLFCVIIKFDDMEHGVPQEHEDQIRDFLRPFLEIENPRDYIAAVRKDANGGIFRPSLYTPKNKGNIKYIVVRDGDLVSMYSKDGEDLKVSHNADEAALSLAISGRPGLKEPLRLVMSANKTESYLECLRILINDAMPDVETMLRNNSLDYSMNEYGIVPKKTHDATSENINPHLLHHSHRRNADNVSDDDNY